MGIWDRIKSLGSEGVSGIPSQFETAELPSNNDCQGCPQYPSSLKIETGEKLFGTAARNSAQILVATGRTDWNHDIGSEKEIWGHVISALNSANLSRAAGGPVRINGTDLATEDVPAGKVLVIVVPQFLKVITTPKDCVKDVLQILSIKSTNVDVASLHPAEPYLDRGLIMVCSHASRDKRCGITAPILRKQLEIELRHHDLYRSFDDDTPDGIRVVYVNHVGGHKYAANCFVYQNNGDAILMARVGPQHARLIVEETIGKSIVFPELTRNCNRLEPYNW